MYSRRRTDSQERYYHLAVMDIVHRVLWKGNFCELRRIFLRQIDRSTWNLSDVTVYFSVYVRDLDLLSCRVKIRRGKIGENGKRSSHIFISISLHLDSSSITPRSASNVVTSWMIPYYEISSRVLRCAAALVEYRLG